MTDDHSSQFSGKLTQSGNPAPLQEHVPSGGHFAINQQEFMDQRERRKRRREAIMILVLSALFIVLTIAEFRLSQLSSTLPFVNSIFFFGLLNINIVLLIALVWLVLRNIGKLFLERRRKVLGARLKTKLVISFLAFSIIPTLVLFIISAMYINSSFDKWFSLKIQNTLQASLEITGTYYRNTEQTAMHFAEHLAGGIGKRLAARLDSPPHPILNELDAYLTSQRELLALDAIEFYTDPLDARILAQRAPVNDLTLAYPRLPLDLLEQTFSGETHSVIQHIGSGDLIRCMVPVRAGGLQHGPISGVLVVNSYIPVSLVNKVDEIASVFDDYKGTNPLKYPMKTAYLVILIMITLVIIVVAIWIGLYMARELTVPVERLVHGAQAVGAGNLDVSILSSGNDEITVLVESFNKMTHDLRENRARLIEASTDLEKRRLQLEAVLGNIGAGVIAIDSDDEITTWNRSAAQLLGIEADQALGKSYREVFRNESAPLVEIIDRARQAPVRDQSTRVNPSDITHWNLRSGDSTRTLAAMVTPIRESDRSSNTWGNPWGWVLVIDDMTHLIKGQREMAWREVARRIAHEIKNPLTPIKLSAQRLQRRLGDYRGRDGALLKECTDTIIQHTDELKEMVNEFSNFARFPEANPAPHDLNSVLREVISLFEQAHSEIHFKVSAESKLPIFDFDRDQIKRVIINLLDNAVAALSSSVSPTHRSKQISIATHYNGQLQIAVLEIEDNGPGMSEDVKNRVFEPYFSTKAEGTGLGLAIVKRIVNDHDGFIRVHSVPGEGTRFLIEIPTAHRKA
jgi:two-component system nitrogen regulation sensor histidine kinase NtrY